MSWKTDKKSAKKNDATSAGRKDKNGRAGNKKSLRPFVVLLTVAVCLFVIGIFVPKCFADSPAKVESAYTRGLFADISDFVGYLPSLTDVSFTEVVFWLIIAAALLWVVFLIRSIVKRTFRLRRLFSSFCVLTFVLSLILNLFNLMGGLNYYKTPLSELMQLEVKDRTATQLYGMCVALRSEANALRERVPENGDGVFAIDDEEKYFKMIAETLTEYEEINVTGRKVLPAKRVRSSFMMSFLGISGIYMPFFAEANVNTSQPALLKLASAAHENAHAIGYAGEDEANFIAYLVCMRSEDVSVQYSGTMHALIYSAKRLRSVDADAYAELVNGFSDGLRRDITDYNEYWGEYDGALQEMSDSINDTYLKYNGKKTGVDSYDDAVDLLLAYFAKENGHS